MILTKRSMATGDTPTTIDLVVVMVMTVFMVPTAVTRSGAAGAMI